MYLLCIKVHVAVTLVRNLHSFRPITLSLLRVRGFFLKGQGDLHTITTENCIRNNFLDFFPSFMRYYKPMNQLPISIEKDETSRGQDLNLGTHLTLHLLTTIFLH